MTGNRILMAEEIKRLKTEVKQKNEIIRQLKKLIKEIEEGKLQSAGLGIGR